jgi:hypothetical protein
MPYKSGHFDNLYLVVDQQNRWKSELLPVPASALLDPLLIGEKRERSRSSYFLIDQFDLTKAKDYLADEFATKPDGPFACHQQPRSSATRLKSNEIT